MIGEASNTLSLSHQRAARAKLFRLARWWRANLLLGHARRWTLDRLCSGRGGGRASDPTRNHFGTFHKGVCSLGRNSWLPWNGEVAGGAFFWFVELQQSSSMWFIQYLLCSHGGESRWGSSCMLDRRHQVCNSVVLGRYPQQTAHRERFFIAGRLWLRALLTQKLPPYPQIKYPPWCVLIPCMRNPCMKGLQHQQRPLDMKMNALEIVDFPASYCRAPMTRVGAQHAPALGPNSWQP